MASTNLRDGYIYFILYYILYSYIYIFRINLSGIFDIVYIHIPRHFDGHGLYFSFCHEDRIYGFNRDRSLFLRLRNLFSFAFFFFYLYNKFYIENPDIILIENIGRTRFNFWKKSNLSS